MVSYVPDKSRVRLCGGLLESRAIPGLEIRAQSLVMEKRPPSMMNTAGITGNDS